MRWEYRDTVLTLCTLAFFVTYVARLSISPVIPFITGDFSISNTHIGIALSGMWIAYGLTQYPSGVLADQYGAKRVIAFSIGGTAVANVIAALSPFFAVFFVAVIGIGVLGGLHYTVATALVSNLYEGTGTAVGVHSLGAPLAGLIGPAGAAWVGVRFGWRPAIGMFVIFAIPIFVVFTWFVRPIEPNVGDDTGLGLNVRSFWIFLKRPSIRFFSLVAIIAMFAINGLISFLPVFLFEFHGYSATLAGLVFSFYFFVRAGSQTGVGAFSDRFDRELVVAVCLLMGSVGVALYLTSATISVVVIATVLFAFGHSFFTALEPKILDTLPADDRNAGFGVFRTVYIVGGSTGSMSVGLSADTIGWIYTFLGLSVLFLVAFIAVVTHRISTSRQ